MLTDDEITRMEPAARRELIARLTRPLGDVVRDTTLRQQRRLRLGVTAAGAALLVPWALYLAVSLPREHRIRDWDVLWVGFDGIEVLLLVATFWLSRQRRIIGILTAFATGVVLLCDAWFDLLTSAPGELWQAVLAAVFLEIPLAVILMSGAFRALRVVSALLWFSDPDARSWEIRFPELGRRGVPDADD
ncbi:MAG: hypothetical protein WB797_03295 [Nocardioides sp.]